MPGVKGMRGIVLWCCFVVVAFLLHSPIASDASDTTTAPEFVVVAATPALLEKLRSGGFVLYMRHGRTDPRQPDQVPIDLEDCATQRPLTDQGRAGITAVGAAVRAAGLPVGEVLASPLCRARESALLAYGPDFQVENLLMYTAHLTSEQKAPVVAKTRELISTPVSEPGFNRMLVAHAPNLADLMGYFPEVEGTVVVFRPLGNGEYEYLASILPGDWDGLLEKE